MPSPEEAIRQARLDELRAVNDEAKELIREGHALVKDLRKELEQARKLFHDLAEERIDKAVEEGLTAYQAILSQSIDKATDAVYKRFDLIRDILLGEEGKKESLLEVWLRTKGQSTRAGLDRS